MAKMTLRLVGGWTDDRGFRSSMRGVWLLSLVSWLTFEACHYILQETNSSTGRALLALIIQFVCLKLLIPKTEYYWSTGSRLTNPMVFGGAVLLGSMLASFVQFLNVLEPPALPMLVRASFLAQFVQAECVRQGEEKQWLHQVCSQVFLWAYAFGIALALIALVYGLLELKDEHMRSLMLSWGVWLLYESLVMRELDSREWFGHDERSSVLFSRMGWHFSFESLTSVVAGTLGWLLVRGL